ncbi:MAG TPA: ATP-binding protein, partial [Polyangiaceae bacterium]|nr:ATP-binding protein [Polyangiaceae bacterium]
MTARCRPLELGPLTEALCDEARALAEARGLSLDFAPASAPAAEADASLYEKIVLNLVGNALKFTPRGGRVRVGVAEVAGAKAVELWVEDTGPGLSPEQQGRLFQRFEQLDGSSTRGFEGTGIGLALVKQFAELMGGQAGVQSEPGQGARFWVRLPKAVVRAEPEVPRGGEARARREAALARAAGPASAPGAASTPPGAPTSMPPGASASMPPGASASTPPGASTSMSPGAPTSMPPGASASMPPGASTSMPPGSWGGDERPRLLLAEDNPEMRAYVTELLGARFEVLVASNGAQALEAARAYRPDVIVSDVMMPVMDGLELARRLKADEELAPTPLILLTARAGEGAAVSGLEGGADDYVTKPFHPAELRARVEAALRLRQALRDAALLTDELRQTHDLVIEAERLAAVGRLAHGVRRALGRPLEGAREQLEGLARRAPSGELTEAIRSLDRMAALVASFVQATTLPSAAPPERVALDEALDEALAWAPGAVRVPVGGRP